LELNVQEVKLIFTGTVGVGKSTAIATISEIPVVSTEAMATDDVAKIKKTTTAGMDYGEVQLSNDVMLRLYGTPGQKRFSFMWEILARGALGFIILVDNSRADPLSDMEIYLDDFADFIQQSTVVIGINKSDWENSPSIDQFYQRLGERGEMFPVMSVDVREKPDVLMLLDTLFSLLE